MQLKTPYDYAIKARKMGKKTISYSQISKYTNCPLSWKLDKIDKHQRFEPNMFLVFGTAFHETFQLYLDTMYNETATAADKLDLNNILKDKMSKDYSDRVAELDGQHFSNPEEMQDFYSDGIAILDWFKKRRGQYFSKKYTELVGIEMPIFSEVEYNNKVMFMGFMDLVMKEHDTIKIIDIKTSFMGWKDKKKKKEGNQLRLYKKYFSEQYGTDIKNIDNPKYPKQGSIIEHMFYLSLCQFTSEEMASGWAFKVINQLQGDQKPNNFKLGPHKATLY